MKYYIDTEFDGHRGPLLSLAMVCHDDKESIHIRTFEPAHDPWVISNIIPLMSMHCADIARQIPLYEVGNAIKQYLDGDKNPIIVADSAVDIARFCQALTTNANGDWVSFDGNISFEVHDVSCYPNNLAGAVQHNAWWDAMSLRHTLNREKVK